MNDCLWWYACQCIVWQQLYGIDGQLHVDFGKSETTRVCPESPLTLNTCNFVSKLMLSASNISCALASLESDLVD